MCLYGQLTSTIDFFKKNLGCKNLMWVLLKSFLVLSGEVKLRLKQRLGALSQVISCSRDSVCENVVIKA